MIGKRWAAWLICAGVLLSGRAAADIRVTNTDNDRHGI